MRMINFINTKGRAFVIFLFSLISMGIFVLSTNFAIATGYEFSGIGIAIGLMIVAIPFHILGKKNGIGYLISFLLNSVANGFSVSAYYLVKEVNVSLYEMLMASVFAAGVMVLVYLMLQIFSKSKKVTITIAAIIILVLMAAAVSLWILRDAGFYSFGFFSLLISMFYLCVFGVNINHEKRPVLRDISFGSFGTFVIITVVVLAILSEGEILDGLDFNLGGDSKRKKV